MAFIEEFGPGNVQAQVNTAASTDTPTEKVVASDDTIGSVARDAGVSRTALLSANPELKVLENVAPGDVVTVPARTGNEASVYVVEPGQGLNDVAVATQTNTQQLVAENDLGETPTLYPGDILLLPDGVNPLAPVTTAAASAPATPLEQAVADADAGKRELQQLQDLAAEGNPMARAELRYSDVAARATQTQNHLESVVESEIRANQSQLSYLPIPSADTYQIAAGQVVNGFDGTASEQALLEDTVNALTAEHTEAQDRLSEIPQVAEDIVNAGSDEAVLDEFTDALAQGDPAYRSALTRAVLAEDSAALGTWLSPGFVNQQADNGGISARDHTLAAQAFVGAYNEGQFPTTDVAGLVNAYPSDTQIQATGLDTFAVSFYETSIFGPPADHITPISDFAQLDTLLVAAGSNPETQQFRSDYAAHLNESYVQNDAVLNNEVRNVAAAGAALILGGDARAPELARDFLVNLQQDGGSALNNFIERAGRGSGYFNQDVLESQQALGNGLRLDPAEIAQPDALATLVSAFGNAGPDASQPEVAEVAVALAQVPGDHGDLVSDRTGAQEARRDAWSDLFTGHSTGILDALTNPDGLPTADGLQLQAGFADRAEDLGALLRFVQVGDDSGDVATALNDYNSLVRERIEGADVAETAIEESRRLGFFGAAITESVNQGFEAHANDLAKQQALVGFVVDLAISAIPASSLLKGAVGGQIEGFIKDNIESTAAQNFFTESLKGFTGNLISTADGRITSEAKDYILDQVGDKEVGELLVELADSNAFIRDQLFADLPAPGYTDASDIQSGRADVISTVQSAYDIAFEALRN